MAINHFSYFVLQTRPGILFLCHIAKEDFGSEILFDSVAIKKGKILKEMERTDSFFEGSDLFFWLDLLNPVQECCFYVTLLWRISDPRSVLIL